LHLIVAQLPAILRPMRHVVRTVVAVRIAVSRLDLFLESLGARHQLRVPGGSQKRPRRSTERVEAR
jgi:hypothetical protein